MLARFSLPLRDRFYFIVWIIWNLRSLMSINSRREKNPKTNFNGSKNIAQWQMKVVSDESGVKEVMKRMVTLKDNPSVGI